LTVGVVAVAVGVCFVSDQDSCGMFKKMSKLGSHRSASVDVGSSQGGLVGAIQKATFGGGCFWGMEKWYKKEFPNLTSTGVGYLGGDSPNPTYKEVCSGRTGHAEVLQVEYNPELIKYRDLVVFFFRIHDPTTLNRQGNDVGSQYRSAIFYHTPEQKKEAQEVKQEVEAAGRFNAPIVTEITAASAFYKAEDYHQNYLDEHPGGYCNHRPRW